MVVYVGLTLGAAAQEAPRSAPPKVHRMEAGETMEAVAKRFLGSDAAVQELLSFNRISDAATVAEGFLLALPGPERDLALERMEEADLAKERMKVAQAERYAPEEFRLASSTLSGAITSLSKAAYDKARALADLGIQRADLAVRLADERAKVPRDGRIMKAHGEVTQVPGNATDAIPVHAKDVLPFPSRLQTGPGSRVVVALPDGSRLQLMEETDFALERFWEDERTGQNLTLLRLRRGVVAGRVSPKKEASRFEVAVDTGAVRLHEGDVRIGVSPAGLRVMRLRGPDIEIASGGFEVAVKENHALALADRQKNRLDPADMLGALAVQAPRPKAKTALQAVPLSWSAGAPPNGVYAVEVATDRSFTEILQNEQTTSPSFTTQPLADGTYYWRVASVDREGLKGWWSQARSFTVKANRNVTISTEAVEVEHNGGRVVAPGTVYRVTPASTDTSVVGYEVSVNRSPFLRSDAGTTLNRSGNYHLSARGVGVDGQPGAVVERTVVVDGTPPVVDFTMSQVVEDQDGESTITFSAAARDDTKLASIGVSINNRPFERYTKPLSFNADIRYIVRIRATDIFGNVSPTQTIEVARPVPR